MRYTICIESERLKKMKKNIKFEMSNGSVIHILHTNVFKAHMKVLKMIREYGWNLEVMKIKVEKF